MSSLFLSNLQFYDEYLLATEKERGNIWLKSHASLDDQAAVGTENFTYLFVLDHFS
jgi:hypothetical protein